MPLFWKSLKLGNPELASALNEKLTAQELQHLNYEVEAYAAQTAANALQKAVTAEPEASTYPVTPYDGMR